jgi:hypothetical protein
MLEADTAERLDRALCILFNAGLFGVSEESGLHFNREEAWASMVRPQFGQKDRAQFIFTFRIGRPERMLYHRLNHQPNCPVAFAPMLLEYCSLKPADKYVIL